MTVTLTLWAVALWASPDSVGNGFALTRDGSSITLLSGHFTHYGSAHAWPDIAAFMLWSSWVERRSRGLLLLDVFVLAPLLSLAVLQIHPELSEYRGLSGLDALLLAEVFVLLFEDATLSSTRRALGVVLAVALAGKAVFDACLERTFWGHQLDGVTIVYTVHFMGAALGALAAFASVKVRSPCTNRSRQETDRKTTSRQIPVTRPGHHEGDQRSASCAGRP
jgi:hypothetical protein